MKLNSNQRGEPMGKLLDSDTKLYLYIGKLILYAVDRKDIIVYNYIRTNVRIERK